MAQYANGEVPANLLVQRPSAEKDSCLMMPGTAAKFDNLVRMAQAEYGWTPVVSGAADGYRTLGMQKKYYADMPAGMAAYPGTSSHGGTYEGREAGAVDIGNWGQVGQNAFFDLARRAGLEPGYFMGQNGRPVEQWHVIDWSPWDAPVPITPTQSEEDDMPIFIEATNTITWANGYTDSYDPNVFQVLRWVAKGQTNEQWCIDIWVGQAWKAAEYMATFDASKVTLPPQLSPDEIAQRVAAALAPKV